MGEEHWFILADGEWCETNTILSLIQRADVLVACDGALNACAEHGIRPHLMIGDGDSVDAKTLSDFQQQGGRVILNSSVDNNDLAKALDYATQCDAKRCTIFGATGGDKQQEWANILTCAQAQLEIRCLDLRNEFLFLRPKTHYSIEKSGRDFFSLFALSSAEDIYLSGCAYPLEAAHFVMGSHGLHNQFSSEQIQLHFGAGRLMMILSRSAEVEGAGEA